MNYKFKNSQKHTAGYMLLEVMVSVLLVSTALIFLTARISQSIQGSNLSEEITVATRLAQSGAEWVKGWRDDVGWNEFVTGTRFMANGSFVKLCWVKTVAMPYALPFNEDEFEGSRFTTQDCANTIDNVYTRRIELEKSSDAAGSFIKYTVIVEWVSGRQDRDVTISGEIRERST
jgi:type II secretory pathway pseudopilin PulG